MARYIKVNPKVARHLRLENDRNQVADGNYLLWQADMLAFGRLTELPSILAQIGGISLQAHEAKEEQDGTVLRKLPIATDPRFIEDVQEPAEDTDTRNEVEVPGNETEAGTQEPADTESEAHEQPETESPDTAEDAQETTDTDSTEETTDVAGTATTINEETEV